MKTMNITIPELQSQSKQLLNSMLQQLSPSSDSIIPGPLSSSSPSDSDMQQSPPSLQLSSGAASRQQSPTASQQSLDRYDFTETLQHGRHAQIHRARHVATGRMVVIKRVSLTADSDS